MPKRTFVCPNCNGARQVPVKKASRRKGSGEETVMEDCKVCDGSGRITEAT